MKKYIGFTIIALSMGLASCNDYLDKLPDDRAEINTVDKVSSLLVSAYPTHSANFLLWMSSDNVDDNGKLYTAQPNQDQMYRWEDVESEGNDDPAPFGTTAMSVWLLLIWLLKPSMNRVILHPCKARRQRLSYVVLLPCLL